VADAYGVSGHLPPQRVSSPFWKDADSDIPNLKGPTAEYAKLQ
jgi:hypothetical protein